MKNKLVHNLNACLDIANYDEYNNPEENIL